jgi:hypothetical protein
MPGEVFLEVRHRALPRQLGRRLLEARRRVVVKAVLGAGVEVRFVRHAVLLERGLEGRPHRVDALVVLGVVDQQRRLDALDTRGLGRGAVERGAGAQLVAHRSRSG